MRGKDPDVKPTVGFTLPRVGEKRSGCGATRLLELISEEKRIPVASY